MKSGYVALVGRPNAGKSTLLNALVETKVAIVSDKPQTTRTRILGVKTTPRGADRLRRHAGRPPAAAPPQRPDGRRGARRAAQPRRRRAGRRRLRGDGQGHRLRPRAARGRRSSRSSSPSTRSTWSPSRRCCRGWRGSRQRFAFADIVPIAAKTGDGVAALEAVITRHLPEGEPAFPEDYLTDQPERRIAAELVREQVLAATEDELPFSTAVAIDQFEEVAQRPADRPKAGAEVRPRDLLRIACSILVDRPSQKPILIGKGGDMIKRIGTAARLEIEQVLRRPGSSSI